LGSAGQKFINGLPVHNANATVYMTVVKGTLSIAPGILRASSIQKSLSILTNDYMPFGTNIIVVLNIIY